MRTTLRTWIDNSTDPISVWYVDYQGYIVRIQSLDKSMAEDWASRLSSAIASFVSYWSSTSM